MTLDFDRMPSLVQPRFKGGQGEAETRIFQDDMGKILRLTLQSGSSIGLHTHEDSCEIMYFLSGTGCAWTTARRCRWARACAITAPGVTATVSSTPAQSLW